jgi:prepilin-type N-terminal cleavage/methylation domain-containing protein
MGPLFRMSASGARPRRHGWTLAEMLVSLTVLGIIVGLAAHAAAGQLRFFHGVGEVVKVRAQTGQAAGVVARVLWGISPREGDVIVAMDSALEATVTVGSAVVCRGGVGEFLMASPAPAGGNTLAAFLRAISFGDRAHIYLADSIGAGWIRARVNAVGGASGTCDAFPASSGAQQVQLQEPLVIPAGAVIRFARPLRLSLYKASDRKSYLGMKDWSGDAFNTIQPVAGPLEPYSQDPASTGLLFTYRDVGGAVLSGEFDHTRIATIEVLARGKSNGFGPNKPWLATQTRHLDSSIATFATREAP